MTGQLTLEATGAGSPTRRIPDLTVNPQTLDALLNPLLQRNGGRPLADGFTAAVEGVVRIESNRFAFVLRPRISALSEPHPVLGRSRFTLLEGYGRALFGPVALELGRLQRTVGYGMDGGPMLSSNARGLDQVRLALERPLRLPGPFRALGRWQASAMVGRMNDDRDVSGSVLAIFRLTGKPHDNVEFGINYLNMQGGEGAPDATLTDRIIDTFFFWVNGGYYEISDKVAGVDLLLRAPSLGSELYINFLTTDDRGRFRQPAGGYWEDAIWVVGARSLELGPDGRWEAALEWVHAGPDTHMHHQFTSGLTLDRRVIGNPLGPNAWSWSGKVAYQAPEWRASARLSSEHYSGDLWELKRLPGRDVWDLDWFRLENNPDEIRKRVEVKWVQMKPDARWEPSLRLGYEHVTRFNFTDENRHNFLLQARLTYRW